MAEPLPHLLIFDHAFSSDLVPGFAGDSCDLHIRTLSTILYNMQQADPPKYGAQIAQKPNTTYFKNLPYPALVYNFIFL